MKNEKMITWDSVFDATLRIPGITVSRDEFLASVFKVYCDTSELKTKRPIDLVDASIVDKVAKDVINGQTLKVTTISTVAGIPGGFAMAAAIPADMAQFYYHAIVLAQKLGYIYGWPDLLDDNGGVTEATRNVLTVFIGVMMGAQAASKALGEITKRFAMQVAKRLPQQALTKTAWYPIIKQIGKWLGIQVTKQGVGKSAAKVVPILGGILSGGITLATFRPMAGRLQRELRQEMSLFTSMDNHFYFENEVDEQTELSYEGWEELRILACINVAKIDFDFTEAEQKFLTDMIDASSLDEDKKAELLCKMHDKELTDIDFSGIKKNEIYAVSFIESLVSVINLDGSMKPSEKIYLFKIAKDLDIDKETLDEILLSSRGM